MQLTKREMHMSQQSDIFQKKPQSPVNEFKALLRKKELWTVLLAVGIVLAILAPFGTDTHLRFVPAVAYWSVVASVTFLSASFLAMLFAPAQTRTISAWDWIKLVLTAGFIGLVVSIEVLLLNWAIFAIAPSTLSYSLPLIGNTVAVTAVIFAAMRFISHKGSNAAPETIAQPASAMTLQTDAPALLARLPFDKRGALISLEVQDHYVDVTTTKGNVLILIRLSDAILEAGAGYQVHRSHWVAANQIAAVRKDGPKAVITTQDGRDIPVSRTYVPVLKEAGLLL